MAHAADVGAYLRGLLEEVVARHAMAGALRGWGLVFGLDVVGEDGAELHLPCTDAGKPARAVMRSGSFSVVIEWLSSGWRILRPAGGPVPAGLVIVAVKPQGADIDALLANAVDKAVADDVEDPEVVLGLGLPSLHRRDDEEAGVDCPDAGHHVLQEADVPGDVDDADLDARVEHRGREAEVDGEPATPLLLEAVGVPAR